MKTKHEVFFCRISSGGKFDKDGNPSDKWSTPIGQHPIYRKLISLYMSGPITGNWPGVAWTSFITGDGVAVHSTYWHNEFGVPRSHGCINVSPEDAKWIFRWTVPHVPTDPGEVDVHTAWPPVGTVVEVIGIRSLNMNVTIGLAFLAGLASFLSPCVFSLVPAYISYLSGRTVAQNMQGTPIDRWDTFSHGLAFVLGFSVIFIILGITASALGRLLFDAKPWLSKIGGIVVILFGIHLTGIYPNSFFRI